MDIISVRACRCWREEERSCLACGRRRCVPQALMRRCNIAVDGRDEVIERREGRLGPQVPTHCEPQLFAVKVAGKGVQQVRLHGALLVLKERVPAGRDWVRVSARDKIEPVCCNAAADIVMSCSGCKTTTWHGVLPHPLDASQPR